MGSIYSHNSPLSSISLPTAALNKRQKYFMHFSVFFGSLRGVKTEDNAFKLNHEHIAMWGMCLHNEAECRADHDDCRKRAYTHRGGRADVPPCNVLFMFTIINDFGNKSLNTDFTRKVLNINFNFVEDS